MLILKRPWTQQPQGAVAVNWGNPITRGIDVFLPNVSRRSIVGTANVIKAGSPIQTVAPFGVGIEFTSGLDYYNTTNWPVLADGTQYTYLVVYYKKTTGTLDFLVNGDNAYRAFQVRIETSGAPSLIGFNTVVGTAQATGVALGAGSVGVVVARQTAGTVDVFQLGARTGTANTTGTIQGQLSNDIQIGNRSSAYLRGSIGLIVRWPRALSDGEAASLSVNPWQLFAPQQIIIPTPAAAGYTHPTLSAATAIEIGATSFKPSVTYTFA